MGGTKNDPCVSNKIARSKGGGDCEGVGAQVRRLRRGSRFGQGANVVGQSKSIGRDAMDEQTISWSKAQQSTEAVMLSKARMVGR